MGPVSRDVRVATDHLELGSKVARNVEATFETLAMKPGAQIGGKLSYQSPRRVEIAPGVALGEVTPTVTGERGLLAFVYGWIRGIIGFAALGLIIALISPRFVGALPATLKSSPLKSAAIVALAMSFPAIAYVAGLEVLSRIHSERARRVFALLGGLMMLMLRPLTQNSGPRRCTPPSD